MSLGLFVRCDCWKKGKVRKLEFDKYIVDIGYDLDLNLPEKIKANKALADRYMSRFYDWVNSACEHEYMWKVDGEVRSLPFIINKYGGQEVFPAIYFNFYENHTDIIPLEMNKELEREVNLLVEKAESIDFDEYDLFTELFRVSEETGNPICFC